MTGQAQVSWILWLTWSSKVELPLSKAVPAVPSAQYRHELLEHIWKCLCHGQNISHHTSTVMGMCG